MFFLHCLDQLWELDSGLHEQNMEVRISPRTQNCHGNRNIIFGPEVFSVISEKVYVCVCMDVCVCLCIYSFSIHFIFKLAFLFD